MTRIYTSQTLLPLSYPTHSKGVEAILLITASLEASADSSCLSLLQLNALPIMNGDSLRTGLWLASNLFLHTDIVFINLITLAENFYNNKSRRFGTYASAFFSAVRTVMNNLVIKLLKFFFFFFVICTKEGTCIGAKTSAFIIMKSSWLV